MVASCGQRTYRTGSDLNRVRARQGWRDRATVMGLNAALTSSLLIAEFIKENSPFCPTRAITRTMIGPSSSCAQVEGAVDLCDDGERASAHWRVGLEARG